MKTEDFDIFAIFFIIAFLIVFLLVIIITGTIFLTTAEMYELERPCIDERGAEFKDEICKVEIKCSKYIPQYFDMINHKDCQYVEGWRE